MHSKYFNAEILSNLEDRLASLETFGRFDGYNTGDTYVVYVSTNADERIRSNDVKRHLRNLFLNDDEDMNPMEVSRIPPSGTRLTEEKIKKIIMEAEMSNPKIEEIKDDDEKVTSPSFRSVMTSTDQNLNESTQQFDNVNSKILIKRISKVNEIVSKVNQLEPDAIVTKNSTSEIPVKVKGKISNMGGNIYCKSHPSQRKIIKGGDRHFEPNTKCSSRHQEEHSGLPSDICELEQLLHKLTLFNENRQLGGSVDHHVNMDTSLDKQILNVIIQLENLIENWKQRPLSLTGLFVRQARLRFRKHILGCAANTWNTLGNVRSLRNICIAVRSCVALLRELFHNNNNSGMMVRHQYDNEDNMSPTLLGPSFDEPLVVVVDRLYFAYLWLFYPKSLENSSSQL